MELKMNELFNNRYKEHYKPGSGKSYKISRSGIELYVRCPRCFYLDKRFGIGQPGGLPFTLNSAVDSLLKKEFDTHRVKKEAHPLMKAYKIDAVPFPHEMLEEWRSNFKGIRFLHKPTNLLVTGAIDDVWKNSNGELHIVDYKATAVNKEVSLDDAWKESYKRQMEIYQWLFRQSGFTVSSIGYFVYCNGIKDKTAFDGKLEFKITLLPYEGDDSWIEKKLGEIKECLESDVFPKSNADCEFCNYRVAIKRIGLR
jgi:hypothetical protein